MELVIISIFIVGIASFLKPFQGVIQEKQERIKANINELKILIVGLVIIIFAPIFKTITLNKKGVF